MRSVQGISGKTGRKIHWNVIKDNGGKAMYLGMQTWPCHQDKFESNTV